MAYMNTHHPTLAQLQQLTATWQEPHFIYRNRVLSQRAQQLMALTAPYGLTVRYAMKANNHPQIIRLLADAGLQFDASSSYEAQELLDLGIPGHCISLSSQQPAHNLPELLAAGVHYVATSLHQLELFLRAPNQPGQLGLRINPGVGSGHNKRTTTGGVSASFGLWHEYLPQALATARQAGVSITRLHIHIGSGADPAAWAGTMQTALQIAAAMPDVVCLDIGGGFKVARVPGEHETDIAAVMHEFHQQLVDFAHTTGRELQLEIEPGTWLVAHAGTLLAQVVDCVDTGAGGYQFLRLNTGMNDILRPSMYGAQHAMTLVPAHQRPLPSATKPYVIVGHNCESGDILTPAQGNPEEIAPRVLLQAQIGDWIAIHSTGAYCRSMAAHGYNSYPSAHEVFIEE